jgi:F-type H+-transporting ATPase subunit a
VRRLLSPKVLIGLLIVIVAIFAGRLIAPVPLPHIQLPAEPIHLGPITLPNTFLATLLADVTIVLLAIFATRNMKLVPSGLQNVMEWIVEGFYNLTEDIAGHNARKFFPWVMTIFLLVLTANWWELVPGVDSIGWIESHSAPGTQEVFTHYEVRELIPGVVTIVDEPYTPTYAEYRAAHDAHALPTNERGQPVGQLVPFIRAAATDLNFTLALSLITMFMVQFFGVQALGAGYFSKFLNFGGGPIGFIVGIIETISEFAKILSFAFRLFGNIFAGQVLLFVMAFLIPWLLPVPIYALEIFVSFIQALVFALLALVFFSTSVIGHDDHH